jgi:hypothetical protein
LAGFRTVGWAKGTLLFRAVSDFFEDVVEEWIAALLAHLGFKPKANSSSPLKRTKGLPVSGFHPVLTGFGDEPWFFKPGWIGRLNELTIELVRTDDYEFK